MRIVFALLAAFAFLAGGPASAQIAGPPVTTTDPGAYARAFSDSMALTGGRQLRDIFTTMLGPSGAMPSEVDQSIRVYENDEMERPARVARVLDDVVASDAYRVIYLYHYFGGNYFLFTRLEFTRISTSEWALSRIAFADRWSGVVLATTPGFAPPQPLRRRR